MDFGGFSFLSSSLGWGSRGKCNCAEGFCILNKRMCLQSIGESQDKKLFCVCCTVVLICPPTVLWYIDIIRPHR